jgi:hypothetical protein
VRTWLTSVVTHKSVSKPGMRGGGADSGVPGKSGLGRTSLVPTCSASIDPVSRKPTNNSSGAGAGQVRDDKGKSTVRAGPPTSAVHSTKLQRAADSGVPQEVVEEPRSDTATVGKRKESRPQPEVLVTEPLPVVLPDQSSAQWPKGTLATSV